MKNIFRYEKKNRLGDYVIEIYFLFYINIYIELGIFFFFGYFRDLIKVICSICNVFNICLKECWLVLIIYLLLM